MSSRGCAPADGGDARARDAQHRRARAWRTRRRAAAAPSHERRRARPRGRAGLSARRRDRPGRGRPRAARRSRSGAHPPAALRHRPAGSRGAVRRGRASARRTMSPCAWRSSWPSRGSKAGAAERGLSARPIHFMQEQYERIQGDEDQLSSRFPPELGSRKPAREPAPSTRCSAAPPRPPSSEPGCRLAPAGSASGRVPPRDPHSCGRISPYRDDGP